MRNQNPKTIFSLGLGLVFFVLGVSTAQASSCGDPITLDGTSYDTVIYNGKCWLQENMQYNTGDNMDNPNGYSAFGKLYEYAAAVSACNALDTVDGNDWSVPSDADWGVSGCPTGTTNGSCTPYNSQIASTLNIKDYSGIYGYQCDGSTADRLFCDTDYINGDKYSFFWTSTVKSSNVNWSYVFYDSYILHQGLATAAIPGLRPDSDMLSVRCVRSLIDTPTVSIISKNDTTVTLASEADGGDNTIKLTVEPTSDDPDYTYYLNYNNSTTIQPDSVAISGDYDVLTFKDITFIPNANSSQICISDGACVSFTITQGTEPVVEEPVVEEPEDTTPYRVVVSPDGGSSLSEDNQTISAKMYEIRESGDVRVPTDCAVSLNDPDPNTWTWTDCSDSINLIAEAEAEAGDTVYFYIRPDGVQNYTDPVQPLAYEIVSTGEENQTINTAYAPEQEVEVSKFSLKESNVAELNKIKVEDNDEEDEIKLDLSKVTTTADNKKTVTLTGTSEKLKIERKSGIDVEFDLSGTTLTADDDWSGEIIIPTVIKEENVPNTYGVTDDEELKTVFKIGDLNNKITLSKAARITIPNEGDRKVMYFDSDENMWVDVPTCESFSIETQSDANAVLANGEDCYMPDPDDEDDMVIYTKHFSFFSTFISNVVASSTETATGATGSTTTTSISRGVLATIQKFKDMLGGANQKITVASGLNLEKVLIVTRDGKKISIEDLMNSMQGSAVSNTTRLVSFAIGDAISTTSAGALDVDLGGFTKMHIAKNSQVTIKEAKNNQIIYSQGDGEIRYEFDKQDTDMSWEVRTGSVNAVIRGTTIEVLVANGEEIYKLIKGSIDLENANNGETYSLEAGQTLKVGTDGKIYKGQTGAELSLLSDFKDTQTATVGYRRPVNFRDVPTGQWFTNAVMALKNNYIIKGYEGNYFKPSQAINRAEALKIVLMATNKTIKSSVSTRDLMNDVSTSDWFANYVVTADEQNIISGYQDGTFRAGNSITRAEALKIILKAKGITVGGGANVSDYFSDVSASDWFANYVSYAYKNGMITGYSDNTFRPNDPVTRAEFAKMVADINNID